MIDAGTNANAWLVSCIKHPTVNARMNVIMAVWLRSSWRMKPINNNKR